MNTPASYCFRDPYGRPVMDCVDATTGRTPAWFDEQLADCKAPLSAQIAAINICRAYGIKGLCDPAYIANVIAAASEIVAPDDLVAHPRAAKPVAAHAEPLGEPQSEPVLFVREFSVAGPCIRLGPLVKRSEKSLWYRDRDGVVRRLGGWRVARGLVHTEPCVSCRDHERTQYPDGYMD